MALIRRQTMPTAGRAAVLPLPPRIKAVSSGQAKEQDPPIRDWAATYTLRFLGFMTAAIVVMGAMVLMV